MCLLHMNYYPVIYILWYISQLYVSFLISVCYTVDILIFTVYLILHLITSILYPNVFSSKKRSNFGF